MHLNLVFKYSLLFTTNSKISFVIAVNKIKIFKKWKLQERIENTVTETDYSVLSNAGQTVTRKVGNGYL